MQQRLKREVSLVTLVCACTVITIYRDSSVYFSRYILFYILYTITQTSSVFLHLGNLLVRKVVISRVGISSNMP